MDEEEYNRIVKNIEKEGKYIIKEGLLYRIRKDGIVRVVRRYEFEGTQIFLRGIICSGRKLMLVISSI